MGDGQPIRIEERDDRTIIFMGIRELTYETTRELAVDLDGVDVDGRNMGIELRPVRFVRPFGLIYLYWYIRWLLDEHGARRVDVVLNPHHHDLCNYLKRMKLPDVFGDEWPVTIYPIQDRQLQESDLSDSLVELTSFRVDHDNEVEQRTVETLDVLFTQRPTLRKRAEELHYTVSELLSNIHAHSRTRVAALAVQTYGGTVELAFGDGGIGIPSALRPHLDGDYSDAEYVRKALEPGVTSRIGGGGTGLTQLRETVEEEGGHLVIRSGTGEVVVERVRPPDDERCRPLPGTLVEVAFPT